MVPRGNYYGDFDYASAYGTSPFQDASQKLSALLDQMYKPLSKNGSGGDYFDSWGESVARPDDPEVGRYMENVLGGQRKTLDDYVRRAATAGIRRGGMNVMGGPAYASSLHHDAMDNLARGYSDRFREAMDYNKYVKGSQYKQLQDHMTNLQDLLQIQHGFLSGQADWQSRVGDLMHSDWKSDVDWNRAEPLRNVQMENVKRQWAQEDLHNLWERQDRQAATDAASEREGKWGQLLDKMRVMENAGRRGAGWTSADDLWMERLGVEIGYNKPWTRQLTLTKKA